MARRNRTNTPQYFQGTGTVPGKETNAIMPKYVGVPVRFVAFPAVCLGPICEACGRCHVCAGLDMNCREWDDYDED